VSYDFEAAAQTLLLNTAGDPSPAAIEAALRACAKATAEECARIADDHIINSEAGGWIRIPDAIRAYAAEESA
jgi:hypothetical protein